MRFLKTIFVALAAGVVLGAPAASAHAARAGEASAHAAAACNIRGKERKLGTTYVTSLSATAVSCSTAKRFVKSFHRCRHHNGGDDGKCSRLSGYRCSERREGIATQYDSRATCARGKRKIVQIYTQNT